MTTAVQDAFDFAQAQRRRRVGAMAPALPLNIDDRETIRRLVHRCALLHHEDVHVSWLRDLDETAWDELHNPGSLLSALANAGFLEGTGRVERNGRGSNAAKWAPVYRLVKPIPDTWAETGR